MSEYFDKRARIDRNDYLDPYNRPAVRAFGTKKEGAGACVIVSIESPGSEFKLYCSPEDVRAIAAMLTEAADAINPLPADPEAVEAEAVAS